MNYSVNGAKNWSKTDKPMVKLIEELQLQQSWVTENVDIDNYTRSGYVWYFKREEDMLAFKLRFGCKR